MLYVHKTACQEHALLVSNHTVNYYTLIKLRLLRLLYLESSVTRNVFSVPEKKERGERSGDWGVGGLGGHREETMGRGRKGKRGGGGSQMDMMECLGGHSYRVD